mgnify:CR=1 FL=1
MARRVRFFDSLRGLSVLSMVGFHLCYDLRYLAGLSLPWFQGTFQNIWRATISWVFLFLAGVMSSYSQIRSLRLCHLCRDDNRRR